MRVGLGTVPVSPPSPVCLCSLPRACLRSEQRLEVQEQLLALRHWLDAVEKRLLALPEPGTALQVTPGLGCDWAVQSRAGPAHGCTEGVRCWSSDGGKASSDDWGTLQHSPATAPCQVCSVSLAPAPQPTTAAGSEPMALTGLVVSLPGSPAGHRATTSWPQGHHLRQVQPQLMAVLSGHGESGQTPGV